jgi:hypothetical protein
MPRRAADLPVDRPAAHGIVKTAVEHTAPFTAGGSLSG